MIKLVLADDSQIFRNAFTMALQHEEVEVLGECILGPELYELCTSRQPDILLLGIPFNQKKALAAIYELQRVAPGTTIICMGLFDSKAAFKKFSDAGSSCYICKTINFLDIMSVIRQVAAGRVNCAQA